MMYGCPICCIFFAIIQIVLYVLQYFYDVDKYLSISLKYSLIDHYFWTFLTGFLFNEKLLFLMLDLICLLIIEKVISPSWSKKMLFKLVFLVYISCLSTFLFFNLYLFFVSFDTTNNFMKLNGMLPLLGAVLVSARQLMPDVTVVETFFIKMKLKHLPFILTIVLIIMFYFKLCALTKVILFAQSIWISWFYLRYYQRQRNGTIGDQSDSFKFAGFCPNHLEPIFIITSNMIQRALSKFGLYRRREMRYEKNNMEHDNDMENPIISA